MTLQTDSNIIPLQQNSLQYKMEFDQEKIDLLKNMYCKDSSNEEFSVFLHACKRTGLDPFMKQIHALKRWDGVLKKNVLSIQTGIDGYRLIAERTSRYMPGQAPTFEYDPQGNIISATAYIKKMDVKGEWHIVEATAYYDEYVATSKEGKPNHMWSTRPRGQLAKCAEALALRKAFPADLSGVYTREEMEQADNTSFVTTPHVESSISYDDYCVINDLIGDDEEYRTLFMKYLSRQNVSSLEQIPQSLYPKCLEAVKKYNAKKLEKLQQQAVEFTKQEAYVNQ